jgi:hypothetical protein
MPQRQMYAPDYESYMDDNGEWVAWPTYSQPSAAEPSRAFVGRRGSSRVQDLRGMSVWDAPKGLMQHLAEQEERRAGRNPYIDYSAARTPVDNKHTQAIDNLAARLEGYQIPSRRHFIAPSTINQDVPDMSLYYQDRPAMTDQMNAGWLKKDALDALLMQGYKAALGKKIPPDIFRRQVPDVSQ